MSTIDVSRLPEFLRSRRWFGGKGVPISRVQVLDQVELGQGAHAFTLAVLEVIYELGHPERYLAPLSLGPDGELKEAMEQDDLARAVVRMIHDQQQIQTGGGTLRGELVDGGGKVKELSADPAVRRISAEQSNTSVVYDDKVIVKIIRKLDLGNNPEWEVGQFLRKRGYPHTPPLLGGIVLEGAVHSTVAVAHEFVPVEQDGWAWALERMAAPSPTPEFLAEVKRLGDCLGELHDVLASETEDLAFVPEPIGREDLQRWASSIIGEMGVSLASASGQHPELMERREALVARIDRLAHLEPSGMKIRHHGDLHLGQTLRSGGRWLIFDFEGEPARSYAQRREKHSPLRDVAGMLRSFAYACATVELKGAPEGERLPPVRKAFLEGYRRHRNVQGLLPADDHTFEVLLETLELEKLLYELRYELSHRPEWARIPARALLAYT
jgi:maltokinase